MKVRKVDTQQFPPAVALFKGSLLDLNNPASYGDGRRVCAVRVAKCLHNMFDVLFDRLFRDEQLIADVPVPVAARDEMEHFDFRLGKSMSFTADDIEEGWAEDLESEGMPRNRSVISFGSDNRSKRRPKPETEASETGTKPSKPESNKGA